MMRRAVLFRAASEEYASSLGSRGWQAEFVEALRCAETGAGDLADALLDEYDAILLTSARAARSVSAAWGPAQRARWLGRRVYAVGEATASAAATLGLETRVAGAGSAASLAETLLCEGGAPRTFLFPCGELHADTLPGALRGAGHAVRELVVYQTSEDPALSARLQELAREETAPHCLVFFSPSGCEYVHRLLQTFDNALKNLPRFAIGESTARRMASLGWEASGVALQPRAQCVAQCVHHYFIKYDSEQ